MRVGVSLSSARAVKVTMATSSPAGSEEISLPIVAVISCW